VYPFSSAAEKDTAKSAAAIALQAHAGKAFGETPKKKRIPKNASMII